MKIGIISEGKIPQDRRVPLIPIQCAYLQNTKNLDITVEASPTRCFTDDEYQAQGIRVVEDLSDRDILLGIKEVPQQQLIPGKIYFFFSHTIKMQPYNRDLLRAVLKKHIHLIDYEVLTGENGMRLIAFGKYAGMVGAHNALWTYGRRTGLFGLPRMHTCRDYAEVSEIYRSVHFPLCRIVLTGTGRVAGGAILVLGDMGIRKVSPDDFLSKDYQEPVFAQLGVEHYARLPDGSAFTEQEYFDHPGRFESDFLKYARRADIMINGIYWDPEAPAFFTAQQMCDPGFSIRVIADVTCDIAPEGSIPSTLRATTIEDPVFGYDPETQSETQPFLPTSIDMMTIDNLPNELPRDASTAFGEQFIENVVPELMKEKSKILEHATIAVDGRLGGHFAYLRDYVS